LSRKFAEGKNGYHYAANAYKKQRYVWGVFGSKETAEIAFRYTLGPLALYGGAILLYFACGYQRRWRRWAFSIIGICLITAGLSALTLPRYWQDDCYEYRECQSFPHNAENVSQICIELRAWNGLKISGSLLGQWLITGPGTAQEVS
jgi:hypothetical protein